MSKNIWSPRAREEYTVTMPDGSREGLGALDIFDGRPGLWNLVWLHSVRVDTILNWEGSPEKAPAFSIAVAKCIESAEMIIGAITIEYLAETLSPQEFVDHLKKQGACLPIQEYWDSCEGDSWEQLVQDRLKLARNRIEVIGNVYRPKFR